MSPAEAPDHALRQDLRRALRLRAHGRQLDGGVPGRHRARARRASRQHPDDHERRVALAPRGRARGGAHHLVPGVPVRRRRVDPPDWSSASRAPASTRWCSPSTCRWARTARTTCAAASTGRCGRRCASPGTVRCAALALRHVPAHAASRRACRISRTPACARRSSRSTRRALPRPARPALVAARRADAPAVERAPRAERRAATRRTRASRARAASTASSSPTTAGASSTARWRRCAAARGRSRSGAA